MTLLSRRIPLLAVCVLSLARLAAAGPLQDDLKARRARAMEKLGPDTLAIYIRQQALDNLPKTAENARFIEQVAAAVAKYKDIGVRIEDSFLLTETGLENLSAGVPRTLADVERFMANKGTR